MIVCSQISSIVNALHTYSVKFGEGIVNTLGAGPSPVCTSESIWFDFGYCYTPLGGPEKVGAIISVMVSSPEMDRKCDQKGKKLSFSKGVMLYIVGTEISRI